MKKLFHIQFIFLFLVFLYPLSANNVNEIRDMYIEVVYQNYHCYFIIKDSHVTYEDDYHSLKYDPETASGLRVVKYWQQDMRKLLATYQYGIIPEHRIVKYRINESDDWSYADCEENKGQVLLSLLSRIRRFSIEEGYALKSKSEE